MCHKLESRLQQGKLRSGSGDFEASWAGVFKVQGSGLIGSQRKSLVDDHQGNGANCNSRIIVSC